MLIEKIEKQVNNKWYLEFVKQLPILNHIHVLHLGKIKIKADQCWVKYSQRKI